MSEPETDLLYGVPAIAAHLQMTAKQVYHLHDQANLPTFKIGNKVCARRSTLAKHFAERLGTAPRRLRLRSAAPSRARNSP